MKAFLVSLILSLYAFSAYRVIEAILETDIFRLKIYAGYCVVVIFLLALRTVKNFIEEQVADDCENKFPTSDNLLIFPDAAQ